MEGKVSIIVPVYNVEKYVDICLKSILHQTYRNIEVIVVDDGSRDRSGAICDRFAKKDSRITVIHQENGGVSRARNNGIDNASGEYICFVDSDDWLPRDSIEMLVQKIEETEADFVSGNKLTISIKNRLRHFKSSVVEYKDKSALSQYILEFPGWGPVGSLYKTEIIRTNHIHFVESVKSREDTIFLFCYFSHCEKLISIDQNVYFINRLRNDSLTKTYFADYDKWTLMAMDELTHILSYRDIGSGNKYVSSAVSIAAKMFLIQIAENYMFYGELREREKIKQSYDSLKKYIIRDYSDDPFRDHPTNSPLNFSIIETIREHGVGEELYELLPRIGRNQSPLKKLLKSMIAPIKLVYWRVVI